ncbi:GNAT family N-acetyltransferase [Actinoallomurus purpureus]|uniref:GNAT family N-acetyltransferase n=1 Tax=Actinoallomurus purpureus TaxID=478114 RepID=UPI00209357F1|nr:GNAT family N-acetyltransferase [Actinoallomurus purpureus]MCO6007900.1 GNAT family N-acetyltransferase [Actinoallomurus purpureus]
MSADEWHTLLGSDGFYSSHEWIRSLELAHGPDPVIVARTGDGIAGVAPTWGGDPADRGLFSLGALTDGLAGPWDRPFLWIGGRRATANAVPCVPGTGRVAVLQALVAEACAEARGRGAAGVVWPYLPGPAARELAGSAPGARALLQTADAMLHVPPDGMEGLADTARREDRTKWRRESRAFEAHGGVVEWRSLADTDTDRVAELVAGTRARYGAAGGVEWMRRVLAAQQAAGVARTAVVCLARYGGRVVAAAVFYQHRDWLYGRYWGAEENAPPFTYYVLTHYAAVDWAAAHGFRRIHLSVSAWEAKVRRGARLYPLAMVLASADGGSVLVPNSDAAAHNARVAGSWRERFRSRPDALDASWEQWF